MTNQYRVKVPPQEYLEAVRDTFFFDPQTGYIHCKLPVGRKAIGERLGYACYQTNGRPKHTEFVFRGRRVKCHHVAWFLMKRWWPTRMIDHINNNPLDNRWNNLRHVTAQENTWAAGVRSTNILGIKGISVVKTKKVGLRYIARCNGKHIGRFKRLADARKAYNEYVLENRGEYAHVV